MKNFEQWWQEVGSRIETENLSPASVSYTFALVAWRECAQEYEHKLANVEHSKNLKIRMLESKLEKITQSDNER